MLVACWAIALAACGFLAHVVVWRIARPANSGVAILIVFLAMLAVGLFGVAFFAPANLQPQGWSSYAGVAFIYLALMAAYINSYPAIEVDSPTLRLVDLLLKSGPDGLSVRDAYARIGGDFAIKPRIPDLYAEHYVVAVGDKMRLTAKGRAVAATFYTFRRLTGRELGG